MEKVIVLMSTYNGEKYLIEQIESLLKQENVEVFIYVRDDGSTDSTLKILEQYRKKNVLAYYIGENLKPARSFMDLIETAPEGKFYAFCDQDDVWLPDKLFKAIQLLGNNDKPALYYCGMDLVDEKLKKIGYYYRQTQYSSSLYCSCLLGDEIAGCTMVFNNALLKMVRKYVPEYMTMHDGWVHRVCMAVKGNVIGDETPYIKYRQHADNTVGMQKKVFVDRIKLLGKKEKRFSKLAGEMLKGYSQFMSEDDLKFLRILNDYTGVSKKIFILHKGIENSLTLKELVKLTLKLVCNSL